MNAKTIRWGIIGCGNVTEVKSGPAYQKIDGFELKAVMRRNKDKLIDYAGRHNIEKYFMDADDLINDSEIDAIYIATPPDSHLHYALKVAEAGKPCCIEKPMAPDHESCLQITNAFEQKNIPLFVAYYRISLPRFLKIKEWIDTGLIGDIRHINWHYSCAPREVDLSNEYNWRTDKKIAKAGYYDDLACHGLDLFVHLLGNIRKAVGVSTNQANLYSAKDTVSGSWIHKNGITGTGSWNFVGHHYEDEVRIIGSEGKIEFSIFKNEPILLDSTHYQEEIFIEHPENIQYYHVLNMKKQLSDGNFIHPSTGESATHVAWVMDEMLKD
jgi:predicted dehydrogenase